MSIIQNIREKYAAAVIGLIALSLIGFILMDAGSRGAGSGGVNPTDAIGSINGSNISYETFINKTKLMESMYAANGRTVDENTRQQINSDTWRTMVESEIFTQEFSKLGLSITDKEFNDLLFGKNPPQFLTQEFTDPATGQFDAAKAKAAIAQLKKQKNNPNTTQIDEVYLKPLMENTLRKKYQALLQNSTYIPTWMAEKTIADNNSIASFQYVTVPYATIADSTIKITDDQINTYVAAHASQFKQDEATRNIAYVSFPFNPSAADTAEVLKELNGLKSEFETSDDAALFVTRSGSIIPFYDGFNSKARIQIPAKDSIIGAGTGKVYGPYLDGSNYVLSRVMDVRTMPDSVKARHILVATIDPRTQQPLRADSVAKLMMDSIVVALKGGTPFELLALQKSDDGSKTNGGDLGYFTSGTMVKEFNDFCFDKKTGEAGVVKTQFGYHYIQITDQKNFQPSYKIAYLAKPLDPSQETISDALGKANIFASQSRNLKAFDENISKQNLSKLVASDIKELDFQIPALGTNRKVIREIFEKSVGDVLDPEEFGNQYVVIAVSGTEKAGLASATKARPQVENILRNEAKAKQLAAKIGKPVSLEAVAQAQNTTVQRADSVSFASPLVPNAGYELKVGGYAFNKAAQGKISTVIGGTSGVFIIKPEAVGAKSDASANLEDTRKNLEGQLKNAATYSSMQALRSASKIKDSRSKFL